MTFLTPIPAIIAACVGVPLLVVLYLLKLRRRPVRVSSTLLWRSAVHDLQVNVPFRWLRPTWLFILQLLILGCFIAALGRPALQGGAGSGERAIILIDRSASMSATDGSAGPGAVSRLDEAKAKALDLIDQFARASSTPSIALVEFAGRARVVAPMTQNLGDLRAAIRGITPSDQPGDLDAAVRLVSAMLAESDTGEEERVQPATVHLLSDGGFAESRGLSIAGGALQFTRVGPTSLDGRDNLGIVAIAARRGFDDPGVVRIFARVASARVEPTPVSIALQIDGREVDRRVVEVPSRGEASLTFSVPTREAGLATLRIDRDDLLAADNSASLVLRAAGRARVLVVVPEEQPSSNPADAGWMLRTTLSELGLIVRAIPASAYERDVAAGLSLGAELVVFDRVRPRVAPPVPTLSFGAGLPEPGLDARGTSDAGTYVLSWERSHPALRSVALDAVYVARTLRLPDSGAAAPVEPGRSPAPSPRRDEAPTTELARGAEGPLILLKEDRGLRRIVVGFELAQSNWPVQVTWPIFVASAVDYLTLRGDDAAGVSFTTSEPAEVELPAAAARAPVLALEGPSPIRIDSPTSEPGRGGRIRFNVGVLERAGVYRVTEPSAGDGMIAAAAVNVVDANESRIDVADRVRIAGDAGPGESTSQTPRELWPWFVLAAAALLCVEWLIYAWRMKV